MKARADRDWMSDGRVMNKPRLYRRLGRWVVDTAGWWSPNSVGAIRNAAALAWAEERERFAAAAEAHAAFIRQARRLGCPVPLDEIDERLEAIASAMQTPQWLNGVPGGWGEEVVGHGPFN